MKKIAKLHLLFTSKISFLNAFQRCQEGIDFKNQWVTIVLDGTEQQIYKPIDNENEKLVYSGKKKYHSLSKLIACSPKGRIYWISQSYEGSKTDASLYLLSENWIHNKITNNEYIIADKAWQGWANERIISPIKGKLNEKNKKYNNKLASIRIIVENVIEKIKEWKICKFTLRIKTSDLQNAFNFHDKVWTVCVGLHNLFHANQRKNWEK